MSPILVLLFVPLAQATAQIPDVLIMEGNRLPLLGSPLDWRDHDTLRRVAETERWGMSTACWRRYRATWELERDVLWLVSIGDCHSGRTADLELLWPDRVEDGRVRASWVDETLRVGLGEIARYVHGGYGSTWERELFLTVENGQVTNERLIVNRPPGWTLFQDRLVGSTFFPKELAETKPEPEFDKDGWVRVHLRHPTGLPAVTLATRYLASEETIALETSEARREAANSLLQAPRRTRVGRQQVEGEGEAVWFDRRTVRQIVVVYAHRQFSIRIEVPRGSKADLKQMGDVILRGLAPW